MLNFQVVDAFSRTAYGGNPTCVTVLPIGGRMSDGMLARLARESGQPTTSFVDLVDASYRTFDRQGAELPMLSGHSTLGVAAAVMARDNNASQLTLRTKHGDVHMARDGDGLYEIGLPLSKEGGQIFSTCGRFDQLAHAFGLHEGHPAMITFGSVLQPELWFMEVTPAAFASLQVDIAKVRALPVLGAFVTAEGMAASHPACTDPKSIDFSVRYFVPKLGIDEDIATGSIHNFLYPFWASRLGVRPLRCWQNSARGGLVRSRRAEDGRVHVAGHCALSLRGTAPLPDA